jgi:hypothetical protein
MRAGTRIALVFASGSFRGFLSARGWRARIVWRFRRQAKFGFELGDARSQSRDFTDQSVDARQERDNQRVLLDVAQRVEISRRHRHP